MQLNIQELVEQNKITYDDILAKMNMQIVGGRLQYLAPNKSQNAADKTNQIYNKYFSKEEVSPTIPVFKTRAEYRRFLLRKTVEALVDRKRANVGRSTKLFFYSQPDYSGSGSPTNANKLFGLMKK